MRFRNTALVIIVLTLSLFAAHSCFAMNWTQINTDGFGNPHNQGLSGAYYNQKLYIATGGDLDVDGPDAAIKVFEYDGSDWLQVNENGFGDTNNEIENTGMIAYNGLLYASTKNVNGTQIWTYDGSDWIKMTEPNNPLLQYCKFAVYNDKLYIASGYGGHVTSNITVQVLIDGNWTDTGFDDDNANEKIDDMTIYAGKLYVSTYSEGNGFQIWAYDEDAVGEKWELVADAGIDDPNNHVCVSMTVYDNRLLASTANLISGGQLWAYDGQDWTPINESGFGNTDNLSVLASSYEDKLFAGTYNSATGGELWMLNDTEWVQVNNSDDFNNSPPMIAPGRTADHFAVFVNSNQGIGIYTLAPPTANAGADLTVTEGDAVVLDGAGSSSTNGNTYLWTQLSGGPVTLSDATVLSPSFTAPETGAEGDTLVFSLAVTDNGGNQDSDEVTIFIEQTNGSSGGGGGGGGGCFISILD